MGFRYGSHMNFQLQLTKRKEALPITRHYMEEAERALLAKARRAARGSPHPRPGEGFTVAYREPTGTRSASRSARILA